jgi:hypothetical protein
MVNRSQKADIENASYEIEESANEYFNILLRNFQMNSGEDNVFRIEQLVGVAWKAAEELRNRRIEYVEDKSNGV